MTADLHRIQAADLKRGRKALKPGASNYSVNNISEAATTRREARRRRFFPVFAR